MLARAKADTSDPAIEYRLVDLEKLALPEEAFDLAYSALAFHYVEDFGRLVRTVHRSPVPDAPFVFIIEHPIHLAAAYPPWVRHEAGRHTLHVNATAPSGEPRTDCPLKSSLTTH